MTRSRLALALAAFVLLVVAGCDGGGGESCASSRDCAAGQECIDGVCRATPRVDGGPPTDGEAPTDGGPGCPVLCGDVDDDGVLDGADSARLAALVSGAIEASECELAIGDVDGDGSRRPRTRDGLD